MFADGALPAKSEELIAVADVTQCPHCIRSHIKRATLKGATGKEIMEAIWVAAEMRAGASSAHSALAIDAMNQEALKTEYTPCHANFLASRINGEAECDDAASSGAP